MTDRERHHRASEIFLQACELPPDEQAAFIKGACGGDAALEAEVESLLAHDRQAAAAGATHHLEEVVGREADGLSGEQTADGPTMPRHIGRYRIVRLIARGGMGEVYEAEQSTPVKRRVAIKVIRSGLDSAEVLARFMAERQALALMSHPHIAAIHDAGATREGRPYVVMEYVDGEPATDYARRHRLDLGARLDLFLKICEAVSHAHQKGIIHRDLKPSNILVARPDGRMVPKVIDFGIAKATEQPLTERTLETSLGQLVGTPEYMSPEQAAGTGLDVDTRADVYALGAILYELLAGTNPLPRAALKQAGLEEMLRLIREHEPVRPSLRVSTLSRRLGKSGVSERKAGRPAGEGGGLPGEWGPDSSRPEGDTLGRKLAGDLDWITLRALEKDRERRYGSVADLAEDIRRYRRHEPVLAGPPSRVYRLKKFVRRNRSGVAFGILLLAVLVISGAAVTWQWRTAVAERERAEAAGDHARQEAARAEGINAFLQDMLASADPGEMGKDVTVREVLDHAAATLEQGLEAEPEARADAHHTLGVTYVSLGMLQEGRSHLERALALRRDLHGPDHESIAEELRSLGWCLHQLNQEKEARRLILEGLRMQRRLVSEPDVLIGRLLSQLAVTELALGNYEEAERLGHLAVAQFQALGPSRERDLGSALLELAQIHVARRNLEDGVALARRALELHERLLGPDHPITLGNLHVLAGAVRLQGPPFFDEAEQLQREALERARAALGDDHHTVADYRNNLAVHLMESRGRLPEAREQQLEALRIWQKVFHGRHTTIVSAMNNLGYLEMTLGHNQQAADWYQQAMELGETLAAPAATMQATGNLGTVRHYQGRYAEAWSLRETYLAHTAEKVPRDGRELWAWLDLDKACLLLHMNRLAEAEALLAGAGETLVALAGKGEPRVGGEAMHKHRLGLLRALQGRWDEAEPLLVEGLARLAGWEAGQAACRHQFQFGEQVCRSAGRLDLAEAYARSLRDLEAGLAAGGESPEQDG